MSRWTRVSRRLSQVVLCGATLAVAPLVLSAGPASAATADTVVVGIPGSSPLVEPLPAGTPDVATPLSTELLALCGSIGQLPVDSQPFSTDGVCVNEPHNLDPEVLQIVAPGVEVADCSVIVLYVALEPPSPC